MSIDALGIRILSAFLILSPLAIHGTSVAQESVPKNFEVASVKRSGPNDKTAPFQVSPDGGLTTRATVADLIRLSYGIKEFQLSGGPGWMDKDEYTIHAKAPEAVKPQPAAQHAELLERIQSLLADRFQLRLHKELKTVPAYLLVVAKDGPKLKEVDGTGDFRLRIFKGRIWNQGGAGIASLASALSNNLQRPVFDQTGLRGRYEFDFRWTPDSGAASDQAAATWPSLFTAITEQLGLELKSTRRPIDTFVVDRLERPSEN